MDLPSLQLYAPFLSERLTEKKQASLLIQFLLIEVFKAVQLPDKPLFAKKIPCFPFNLQSSHTPQSRIEEMAPLLSNAFPHLKKASRTFRRLILNKKEHSDPLLCYKLFTSLNPFIEALLPDAALVLFLCRHEVSFNKLNEPLSLTSFLLHWFPHGFDALEAELRSRKFEHLMHNIQK